METKKNSPKVLLFLHLLLMVYSTSSILSKKASGFPFLSPGFILCYGGMVAVLGIYAIGWQQVIKRMPLTTAYANKAVTVVWGIIWGMIVFHEGVSPFKLFGAAIVLAGVALFGIADSEQGAQGAQGKKGAKGAQGAQGAQGAALAADAAAPQPADAPKAGDAA